MEAFIEHYCGSHDPSDRYPALRSPDTSANYPSSILPILMIIFFNTSIPLSIEISSRTKICVCGKPRSSPRARNRAINSHERAQIMRRANEVPRQHRREPKTAQFSGSTFLRCRILLSVLQPFFSRRWVSMAPSRPPNLSLSPPATRPQLPRPCLPKNRPIFAPVLSDDLNLILLKISVLRPSHVIVFSK